MIKKNKSKKEKKISEQISFNFENNLPPLEIQKEIVRILENIEKLEKSSNLDLAKWSPKLKDIILPILMNHGIDFKLEQIDSQILKKLSKVIEELKKFGDIDELDVVIADLKKLHLDV